MNIKTGIMALAIAAAPLKSTAQNTTRIISKTTTTEVIKTVKPGHKKLSKAAKAYYAAPVHMSAGAEVAIGTQATRSAMGIAVDISKKNSNASGQAMYGLSDKHNDFYGKMKFNNLFPIENNYYRKVALGPEVGLHGNIRKAGRDLSGNAAVDVKLKGQYKKRINPFVTFSSEAGVGAAAPFRYNNKELKAQPAQFVYDVKAGLEHEQFGYYIKGGKDVHLGDYVSVGIKKNF